MGKTKTYTVWFYLIAMTVFLGPCGFRGSPIVNFPIFVPTLENATPQALIPSSHTKKIGHGSLPVSKLKARFFSGSGPNDVFTLLKSIDNTISSVDGQAGTSAAECLIQTPVAYTIRSFDGTSVNMFAQCYEQTATGFIQWGLDSNKNFYAYEWGDGNAVAAIATPNDQSPTKYDVTLWVGMGYSNGTKSSDRCPHSWDECSYVVLELIASKTSKPHFELVTAGVGMEFAGAQFVSDGTDLFGIGSEDTSGATTALESVCTLANDLSQTDPNCELGPAQFTLTPLGRVAASSSTYAQNNGTSNWAASQYPAEPNVKMAGSSEDTIYFGPQTPTSGVGAFQ